MEDFEISYSVDDELQFWEEVEDIVSAKCDSHSMIDNALRSYLRFTTNFKDEYLQSDNAVTRCSQNLVQSELFLANKDYVRIQLVYCLLQEDAPAALHVIASFLLCDQSEALYEMMNNEGCFPRLLELIKLGKRDDARLHRLLLELMYEMSRVQQIKRSDLEQVDDQFVTSLFQIIEELSDDVDDPYHYPVIRVLVRQSLPA
jgi:hypothetical protein